MHLHDTTISHIAKLIQLSLITGTDIIDHLRMMKLTCKEENNYVYIDSDYELNHNSSINEMIEKVKTQGNINE
jgi:hypothetical protein